MDDTEMKTTYIVADFFYVNLLNGKAGQNRLNMSVLGMSEADREKMSTGNFAIVKNNVLEDLQAQVMNSFKAYGMQIDLQVVRFVEFADKLDVAATINAVDGLFYKVS
jgi:hypothetical protein